MGLVRVAGSQLDLWWAAYLTRRLAAGRRSTPLVLPWPAGGRGARPVPSFPAGGGPNLSVLRRQWQIKGAVRVCVRVTVCHSARATVTCARAAALGTTIVPPEPPPLSPASDTLAVPSPPREPSTVEAETRPPEDVIQVSESPLPQCIKRAKR